MPKKKIKKSKTRAKKNKKRVKKIAPKSKVKAKKKIKEESVYGAKIEGVKIPVVVEQDYDFKFPEEPETVDYDDFKFPEEPVVEAVIFEDLDSDYQDNEEEQEEEQLAAEQLLMQEELTNKSMFANLSQGQKKVIIFTAVTTIMVVIVFFWVTAVKNSLGQSFSNLNLELSPDDQALLLDLDNMKTQIGSFMDTQKQSATDFTNQAQNLILEEQLKRDAANKVKEQLENQLKNSNTNLNSNINLPK